MITIIDKTFSPTEWNNLATHPMQTWEWGEVRHKEGKKIVRFIENDAHGKRISVCLMTIHPLPFMGFSIGYIPKSTPPSKEFLTYLKSYAQKHNIIFVKLEPNVFSSMERGTWNVELISSPHPLFTPWNQLLDITLSEEELLKNLHPKTRYNIRLAEKKGVQVREMTSDAGYQIFERLYFETCVRQKYHGHTRAYHQNIWKTLSQSSDQVEQIEAASSIRHSPFAIRLSSHILVAFYKDIPLAAYQLWHFKNTLYYVYGGSSDAYKNVMAANLLMWESINFGKRLGCTTLDMWGSLPPKYDTKDPWAGFTKFKEGYGTKFVQYVGSYDLIVHSSLYKAYTLAHGIRQRLFL